MNYWKHLPGDVGPFVCGMILTEYWDNGEQGLQVPILEYCILAHTIQPIYEYRQPLQHNTTQKHWYTGILGHIL